MTANPAEVSLTSRGSATVQRVLAGLSIAGVVACMIVLAFSGQPWWAILLWELGMLFVVLIMLAIWGTAGDSAKETAALAAAGTQVLGELTDKSLYDAGDDVYYDLTLWIPLPQGGFSVTHRCSRAECSSRRPGEKIPMLVDPEVRTWAVFH
ncbi:hypothetical protein [Lentzea albidocapillata]|uniref:Uncharacterized protein n=1 Tax=Lentzea albidocapillata TaxID=40571 RepID=A0A1W2BXN0_9PSEU|nr:hypothetical protein [Lentzea albidocapillata]SMC77278.1 hypothetical protein SAMN05660733_01578 [Lentzea albidocapillata]